MSIKHGLKIIYKCLYLKLSDYDRFIMSENYKHTVLGTDHSLMYITKNGIRILPYNKE